MSDFVDIEIVPCVCDNVEHHERWELAQYVIDKGDVAYCLQVRDNVEHQVRWELARYFVGKAFLVLACDIGGVEAVRHGGI